MIHFMLCSNESGSDESECSGWILGIFSLNWQEVRAKLQETSRVCDNEQTW